MVDKPEDDSQPPDPGDEIDRAILEALAAHPRDLVSHVARRTGLTRQALNKRIRRLIDEGWIEAEGTTRARTYRWKPVVRVAVSPDLSEDRIWRQHIAPRLRSLSPNVKDILQYGASEMMNNVIDHSGASEMAVVVRPLEDEVEIYIEDDGVGIFEKLVRELPHLEDPRHAILELSKGKLTTDPERHTGEGIFFTCRMCDRFFIWSGGVQFGRVEGLGLMITDAPEERSGTTVTLVVRRDTKRTPKDVFDAYASEADDFGFTRTTVAVHLARYEGESLVSRSQARRLLARGDRFKEILLDFREVEEIGPAFADEVFRVYQKQHPEIVLRWENAVEPVRKMIDKACRQAAEESAQ